VPSFSKGRVEFNEAGFQELARSDEIRDAMLEAARTHVVLPARSRAPKLTGFGASTIRAEAHMTPEGWEARVSWTRAAPYMRHQQFGTVRMNANPFLYSTLEGPR
jgi:HK97 gp10 family phage protein